MKTTSATAGEDYFFDDCEYAIIDGVPYLSIPQKTWSTGQFQGEIKEIVAYKHGESLIPDGKYIYKDGLFFQVRE